MNTRNTIVDSLVSRVPLDLVNIIYDFYLNYNMSDNLMKKTCIMRNANIHIMWLNDIWFTLRDYAHNYYYIYKVINNVPILKHISLSKILQSKFYNDCSYINHIVYVDDINVIVKDGNINCNFQLYKYDKTIDTWSIIMNFIVPVKYNPDLHSKHHKIKITKNNNVLIVVPISKNNQQLFKINSCGTIITQIICDNVFFTSNNLIVIVIKQQLIILSNNLKIVHNNVDVPNNIKFIFEYGQHICLSYYVNFNSKSNYYFHVTNLSNNHDESLFLKTSDSMKCITFYDGYILDKTNINNCILYDAFTGDRINYPILNLKKCFLSPNTRYILQYINDSIYFIS